MASLNKVTLIGNLGEDPKVSVTNGGKKVARLSVATNESFKSGDQKITKTEWHKVVAWDGLADYCERYMRKGSLLYIEGKIATRSYDPKEGGEKKFITEIVAHSVQGLDPRPTQDGGTPNQQQHPGPGQQPPQRGQQQQRPNQQGQQGQQAPYQQYPGYNPPPPQRGQQQPQQSSNAGPPHTNQMGTPEFFDDDIPF